MSFKKVVMMMFDRAKKPVHIVNLRTMILEAEDFDAILSCITTIQKHEGFEELTELAFQRARMLVSNIKQAENLHREACSADNPKIKEECWQRFQQINSMELIYEQFMEPRYKQFMRKIISTFQGFFRRKKRN